jgi:hypothetical protein
MISGTAYWRLPIVPHEGFEGPILLKRTTMRKVFEWMMMLVPVLLLLLLLLQVQVQLRTVVVAVAVEKCPLISACVWW